MDRRDNQAVFAGVLAACFLLGCNAVLGIDAPKGSDLNPGDDGQAGDGRGGDGSLRSDDGDNVTPAISEEPPSPYAWANWPMPNPAGLSGAPNAQTFGVRSAGVIFDTLTKLEWQQGTDKARSRHDAEEYCTNLRLGGGGFRLPSRIELLSIVDFTQTNPSLDPKGFPDAQSGRYWSSSRHAADADRGWTVNFEFGTGLLLIETADKALFVRCVR